MLDELWKTVSCYTWHAWILGCSILQCKNMTTCITELNNWYKYHLNLSCMCTQKLQMCATVCKHSVNSEFLMKSISLKQENQNKTVVPLCLWSGELTSIVEGLDAIQVFIHFVLDRLQFGPCHASIYQGLGCLLLQTIIKEGLVYIC